MPIQTHETTVEVDCAGTTFCVLDFVVQNIPCYVKEANVSQAVKVRVSSKGGSQSVRIPAEFRFKTDEVYIRHNAATGELTLSEHPLKPSIDEIFAQLDAAGAADFSIDRDTSPPSVREHM